MAHDGRSAVDLAASFRPEVMLLDLGLPDIEGYEVARRVRSNASLARPCLVALTGWGAEEHRRKTTEAGFDEHLVKPVDFAKLKILLARLVG
jgi:DNA-binding response OmpR family regulator